MTAGYYEDTYFRAGRRARTPTRCTTSPGSAPSSACRPAGTSGSPRSPARTRSRGAEVLVYPTAIGSEPDHPGFDTQPLWQQVIVGNGIANGTFMVVPNRIGDRGRRSPSTARRSSPTRTAASWCRPRATKPRCWSPTSTSQQRRDWLDAVPVPGDPPPRHLRRAHRAGHRAPHDFGTQSVTAGGCRPRAAPQDRVWMAFPSAGLLARGHRRGAPRGARHLGRGRARHRGVRTGDHGRRPGRTRRRPALPVRGHRHRRGPAQRRLDARHRVRPSCTPTTARWPPSTGCSTAGVRRTGRSGTATRRSARSSPSWPARRWSTSPLVNEGGGIQVDGVGTVLVTETVQLDPGRNPGLTRADVEAELARTHRRHPRGLAAARPDPRLRAVRHPRARRHRRRDHRAGRLLLHNQRDDAHPDHLVCKEIRAALSQPPTPPAARGRSSRCPRPRR